MKTHALKDFNQLKSETPEYYSLVVCWIVSNALAKKPQASVSLLEKKIKKERLFTFKGGIYTHKGFHTKERRGRTPEEGDTVFIKEILVKEKWDFYWMFDCIEDYWLHSHHVKYGPQAYVMPHAGMWATGRKTLITGLPDNEIENFWKTSNRTRRVILENLHNALASDSIFLELFTHCGRKPRLRILGAIPEIIETRISIGLMKDPFFY
jgi:hypothetical protein